jgi:hypothetical protein
MRRCSRCGGEGRRRVASTVWRGGDGVPFIGVGRGDGRPGGGGALSRGGWLRKRRRGD